MRIEPPAKRAALSLTPFIDVVFLLLLFFLLASTFARFASIDLTLAPQIAGGPTVRAQLPSILVGVREGAAFFVNGQPAAAGELAARLRSIAGEGDLRVVVRPSPGAVAQDVVTAIDIARKAEIGPVILVH